MAKNFSDRLQTAQQNQAKRNSAVAGSPLIQQADEVVEDELSQQNAPAPTSVTSNPSPVTPHPVTPHPSPVTEKTKGIVVDVPISLYYRLRNLKDSRPNESFKSLALQAILEFVDREESR